MKSIFSISTLLLVLLVGLPAFAQDVIDHKPFNALLKTYVKGGQVKYSALKDSEEDYAKLKAYVEAVGTAEVKGSKDAQLAFYLNAYNALVISSVLDNWPVKDVLKVDGFFKKIEHKVAGQTMTLDHLEHTIIRPTFKDARVHFALNCAAQSCPPLKAKAFTHKNVQKVLEANTKAFLPKATKVEGNTVTTSKLLEWFADDFKHDEGSVQAYLARYVPEHAELLKGEDIKITFAEYNWALNGK